MFRAFGDSFTVGVGASPASNSWFNRSVPSNNAASSSQSADVSIAVQAFQPKEFDISTLYIGYNDVARYKNDQSKKQFFKDCYRGCLAWLLLVDKKTARGNQAGITFTGSWLDNPTNLMGRYTTQNGASAKATVSGNSVWIGVSKGNNAVMAQSVNVKIDGVNKGTFSVYEAGVTTFLGSWYGRPALYFSGLGEGPHEVVITHNDSTGKFLHVDYIAGSHQEKKTMVLASNITKFPNAYYSSLGINLNTTIAYNQIINDVISEFQGFDIRLVDNFSAIDPMLHVSDQWGHPNNLGHALIHRNFKKSFFKE